MLSHSVCERHANRELVATFCTFRCRFPLTTRYRRIPLHLSPNVRRNTVYAQFTSYNAQRNGTRPLPAQQPPIAPQRPPASPDDIFLPRSLLMNKEIITRTSGKRLGYINQMYVDPVSLSVVSIYLRPEMLSVGSLAGRSAAGADHVHLYNLVQIGDVVLVHDEQALMSPPADDTCGFYRLIGSVVRTERGVVLGKVRDYLFNPDNGAIATLKVDSLGIPTIPQSMMTTYALSWQEVLGVGPSEVVVRSGAEQRVLKENEGLVGEGINSLIQILTLSDDQQQLPAPGQGDPNAFRTDAPYLEWYAKYGKAYEDYAAQYGQRMPQPVAQQPRQQAQQPPRALPPPRSTPFNQAIQAQPPQQAGQPWRQAVESREAVPAGARDWAAAPPSQPYPPPSQYPPNRWQQQQQGGPRQPQPSTPSGMGEVQFLQGQPGRGPPPFQRQGQQQQQQQQQQGHQQAPLGSGPSGVPVGGRGGSDPLLLGPLRGGVARLGRQAAQQRPSSSSSGGAQQQRRWREGDPPYPQGLVPSSRGQVGLRQEQGRGVGGSMHPGTPPPQQAGAGRSRQRGGGVALGVLTPPSSRWGRLYSSSKGSYTKSSRH